MASVLKISVLVVALAAAATEAGGPRRRQRLDQSFAAHPESLDSRTGRNLAGVFPFANGARGAARHAGHVDHAAHHHADHHAAHAAHSPAPVASSFDLLDSRVSRQRGGNEDIALDIGSIAAAGERCIDKVVMVEETEYDDVIECKHSYSQKCHTTYTTDFEPQQEEECEENFIKSCFIEYKKTASEEKIDFCNTPLICDGEGPIECKTVYESQCETRYHEHNVEDDVVECETIQEEKCEDVTQGYTTEQKCTKWPKQVCNTQRKQVKKYSPETECKKIPRELCGPSGCELRPGPEECFEKSETVITEVPEETCNLEPQKSCKHVTKLVPLLKPAEECVDIPKEVCSRSRTNPRKVQKPVVKKWCYVPTAESGLA